MTSPIRQNQADAGRRALDAGSTRFLYRALTDVLRRRVQGQAYRPGARIPTFGALAAEFKVSTITVRRAIRDLSLEGLLVGRQGLGVFVANKRKLVRTLSLHHIVPIEEDLRSAGVRASLNHRGIAIAATADEPFLAALAYDGPQLVRLDRILLADDEPVALDTIWTTRATAHRLRNNLQGEFIVSQLERHGVVVHQIVYQVEAATATEAQALALGVVPGFPLLIILLSPRNKRGRVILFSQTIARADRFTYQFSGPALPAK